MPDNNDVGRTRIERPFRSVDWQDQALCQGRVSLFFSERNSDNRSQDLLLAERQAKALCVRCPVRRECLEYAVGVKRVMNGKAEIRVIEGEDYGIWGGTLPSERKESGRATRYGRARRDIDTLLDEMDEQAVKYGLVDTEDVA